MRLKNLALITLIISLSACGGDGIDRKSDNNSRTDTVQPVAPNKPIKPVEKVYSFEDVYDVSGFANVGATLTVNDFKDTKVSSNLRLLQSPDDASVKQSAIYSDYGIDLVFDKPGIYKFEYSDSSSIKYIEVEVAESNFIKGPILKESLELSDTSKPYILTSDIGIPNGVTLKVSKGVTLIADNNEIGVEGTLNISGEDSLPVEILDAIIRPVNDGGLIKIHHAEVEGGSIYAAGGDSGYATLDLQNSQLKNLNNYMYLWYPVGEVKIIGNHFVNSGGISFGIVEGGVTSVQILNNKFENWTSGFAIENWANYESNSMIDISHNSFITDDENSYAAVLPSGYSSTVLIMKNNYWGTAELSRINDMIFDKNDNLSSGGYVEFEPFLTSAHPNTPK